jgi:hypothetical protein
MKLQKRVDKANKLDHYILTISHSEADKAFEKMSPFEKGMLADLKSTDALLLWMKVLTIWVQKIEETRC